MSETSPTRAKRLLEDRGDYLFDAPLHLGVIGEGPGDADLAGTPGRNTTGDEPAGIDSPRQFFLKLL